MLRIKALNEDTSDSDERDDHTGKGILTREAQEENLHSMYSDFLKLLTEGENEKAKQVLLNLVDGLDVLEKAHNMVSAKQLRYLAYKNLGILIPDDIDYFLRALEIDSSDISLLIKTGMRAFYVSHNFLLARQCFESALQINPKNWMAIDKLLESHFILNDLYSCFLSCMDALDMDMSYKKAKVLLHECNRLFPTLSEHIVKPQYHQYLKLSDDLKPFYDKLMEDMRSLKQKLFKKEEQERIQNEPVRPKLIISCDTSEGSLKLIGLQLQKVLEKIGKDDIPIYTPVDLEIDTTIECEMEELPPDDNVEPPLPAPPTNLKPDECNSKKSGGESQSSVDHVAISDKEQNIVNDSSENSKHDQSASNSSIKRRDKREDSIPFPVEFLDKRRSTRIHKIHNKLEKSNVYDSLMALLPESVSKREPPKLDTLDNATKEEVGKAVINAVEVEREIVKEYLDKISVYIEEKKNKNVRDLIKDYLYEIGKHATHISIPPSFVSLYKIFRKANPLPHAPFAVWGKHVKIDDIWLTLAANELQSFPEELIFLEQMAPTLESILSEDEYTHYEIRLGVMCATREKNLQIFENVLSVLNDKQISVEVCNRNVITEASVKYLIATRCANTLTDMIESGRFEELINLLLPKSESELSSAEEDILSDAIIRSESWQRGVALLSMRMQLTEKRLKLLLKCIETGERAQLHGALFERVVKYASEKASTTAWACLYWALLCEADDEEEEELQVQREKSVVELISLGHQYLTKKGICTENYGEFLGVALEAACSVASSHITAHKDLLSLLDVHS